MLVNQENINRWNGFADVYNNARPTPPEVITKTIGMYLGGVPDTVIDLGSGTGLSAQIWKDIAKTVIGIEPNDDMRAEAEKNVKYANISFRKGVSNDTKLPADYADVVTVSQAFHWFDIDSTLTEVYRILKEGGVFAVFDCDWPPAVDWQVEAAYDELRHKCNVIADAVEKPAVKNDKGSYIKRFNEFGKFRFVKEIVCHSVEKSTAERIKGIALSQGGIQTAMKTDSSAIDYVNTFCELVDERCKGEFNIVFSYRLRIGVK